MNTLKRREGLILILKSKKRGKDADMKGSTAYLYSILIGWNTRERRS